MHKGVLQLLLTTCFNIIKLNHANSKHQIVFNFEGVFNFKGGQIIQKTTNLYMNKWLSLLNMYDIYK